MAPFKEQQEQSGDIRLQLNDAEQQKKASMQAEIDRLMQINADLSKRVHQAEVMASERSIDLENAGAELLAMRDYGKALAAELENVTMLSKLSYEREKASHPSNYENSQPPADRGSDHLVSDANIQRIAAELQSVYESTSWRITRPLRAIARPRRTISILISRTRKIGE